MIKIAIFASGTGTNFVALARHIEETNVPIRIACLVCDQPDAPVVGKAVKLGVPVWTHRLGEFADKTAYEQAILLELQKYDLKLIVLAGYMKIITGVLLEATHRPLLIFTLRCCLPFRDDMELKTLLRTA